MINKRFFNFRLRQIIQIVKELPLFYLFFTLLFLGIGIYYVYVAMATTFNATIINSVLLLFFLSIQLRRKDYRFICLIEERASKAFVIDYLLLSFPFLITGLSQQQWLSSIFLIIGCMAISFIKQPFRKKNSRGFVPAWIPFDAFELRSTLRQNGTGIISCYLLAYLALPVPYLSIAVLWIYTAFFNSGFSNFESKTILLSQEKRPAKFIGNKLKINIFLYLLTLLPICIVYICIHPSDWWVILYFIISSSFLIGLAILLKYAFYEPDRKLMNGHIAISLSYLSIIIPFLLPVTGFYIFKYYKSALQQLKPYLDAYS